MSSPPAAPLFLFFLSSEAFSSSTAPQAFPRPDRRMLPPARAGCVKAGRFSAATVRLGLYTTEHDGRLDGFGRFLLSCYLSVIVSARVIPITNVLSAGLATKSMARAMFASTYIRQLRSGLPRCCLHGRSCRRDGAFGRSCYEVHGACDVRINLYPAAPIRLAKVLLAWTIVQEGWGSSFGRQIGKRRSAMRTYSHTSDLPDTPDWGCRNSAQCRRYRVRVAPCGTRPCSR